MKRFVALSLIVLGFAAIPCQAQMLQKIEQGLLGGQQQQGMMPGQTQVSAIGTVNLPPGQYLMTNVQTGQAFYVGVQNGQMFYTPPPPAMAPGQGMTPGQTMMPGQGMYPQQQQPGMGGYIKQGLGNFLKNELAPQQQQQPPMPNQ